MKYVLNGHTGVLHTDPASESCNVDAMTKRIKSDDIEVLHQNRHYRRDCKRCMA